MKRTKNLAKILAVSMLMSSFATTLAGAYGDEQPQAEIIIQNITSETSVSIQGKTYEAYKIFDAEITEDSDVDTDEDDTIEYTVNEDFYDFFEDNGGFEATVIEAYDEDTYDAFDHAAYEFIESYSSDLQVLVVMLREYIMTEGISFAADTSNSYSKNSEIETVRTGDIDAGYYIVLDADHDIEDTFASAGMLTSLPSRSQGGALTADVTINIKGSVPTIAKEIWHNDITNVNSDSSFLNGTVGSWDDVSDYQIGDIIEFRIQAAIPTDMTGYTDYSYIITDTMSEGLEFVDGSIQIFTDAALTDAVAGSMHTERYGKDYLNEDFTFELTFDMLDIKEAFQTLEEFYIYYKAEVTEDALIYADYENNEVELLYSNNPYDTTSTATAEDVVYGYTFELDVTKTKGDGITGLGDAVFALYERVTDKSEVVTDNQIYLEQYTDGGLTVPTYYVSSGNASDGDDPKGIIITDENYDGKFNIAGLDDAKTYVLKEIEAPSGYNAADEVVFKITATYSDVGNIPTPTVTATGISDSLSITVVNTSAALLPSTGGIGTTIFTVSGGVIMLAAAAMLVLKHRKRD